MYHHLSKGNEGSSKSVELHVDGRVSHVSLHAAAHATVADLLSTAIAASSPAFATLALSARELGREFRCTDTAGSRVELSALALSVPPQLVVTHKTSSGSVGTSHALGVTVGTVRHGGRGSGTARSTSSVSSTGRGRSRGRGRGRGRSGGRGRASATALTKARAGADDDDDSDDGDDSDDDDRTEGTEGADSGSAVGVASSEGATAEEDESVGGKSNDDSDGYTSAEEERGYDDDDDDDEDDDEGDSDHVDPFAASENPSTTASRPRRGSGVATLGSGRGRGRGRGSSGRGAGRASAVSVRGSSTPPAPTAVRATALQSTRSRSASASPLLFTPDGQPIKRKRGRPPKSQQLAFAAAAAAAAAAATVAGGALSSATGEKPSRPTRRSAKEVPAEEIKPRRGGRRRRSDAEAEVPEEQPRAGAGRKAVSGDGTTFTTTPVDGTTSLVSGSGRRGGVRKGLADVVKKRSRSSSPSSQSPGNSSSASTATQSLVASAVTVVAVGTTSGECARLLSPGALETFPGGAAAADSAAAVTTARSRMMDSLDQRQQVLKAQEEQDVPPRQQRRRVRLTYNTFYPSGALHTATGAAACTGGSGARSHQANNVASSSPLLEDPSVVALRSQYVWNGGERHQQCSCSSAAPLLPFDDGPHSIHNTPAPSSDAWVTLSSLLSSVAGCRESPSAASATSTVPSSHEGRPSQLYTQAQQIVSSWRTEEHRTPSLLLSHPYAPLFMPGLGVYQTPSVLLASPPPPVTAQADDDSMGLNHGRRGAVKTEAKYDQEDALFNLPRASAPATSSPFAFPSSVEGHTSRLRWYQNQSLTVPIVVGGCVQLVNPESKDKSHQWTVYVRGLWNGHPEEVASSTARPPSSASSSHAQPPRVPPSSLPLSHSSHARARLGDANAAADRGEEGGVRGGSTATATSAMGDSQTSFLSTSIASPDDYLSDFIEKVVFVLDESFVPCVRTVTSAPFELTEVGWGEFIVSMHVYLKIPAHTRASRRVQGRLLEYFCGFNGRTAMQTCDGRGTKPHDPVSTYVTGGARGPSHLWSVLSTPLPTTSGIIPPTPARPLHELRHRFHYDSLLDINSNSGARATYYRGPYLPLHLARCNAASSSSASMGSSSDSDVEGGGSDDMGGRSGSEVSLGGGSPTSNTRAILFPSKSELSAEASLSSSRSGSVTPSPVPAPQHHVSSSSQHQEARAGASDTALPTAGSGIAGGLPSTGVAAPGMDASLTNVLPPLQQVPPVRRGPGRRPRRFGGSRVGSRTPGSVGAPGSPAAACGSAGHRPLTEVHVGHGSNVVVLQHLLRFSHRPRYPPSIPPSHDPRTQGMHPELLGYTMVAEPVVTEQYDELVIPLDTFVAPSTQRRSRVHRRRLEEQQESCEMSLKKTAAARLEARLCYLLGSMSSLESRLRTTLRRQLSLMCDDSSSPSSYALPPLSNTEAKALGHPGGISCWPHVLDYGNGIERDTSYTAAYLASIATSAEKEGWLSHALEEQRVALFGSPAASCAPVTAVDSAGDPQFSHPGESPRGQGVLGESRAAPAGHSPGRGAAASPITRVHCPGTWMSATEYDLASALLRVLAVGPVSTARDVFFQMILPRADDIGAVLWRELHEGIPAMLRRAKAAEDLPGGVTGAAALIPDQGLWRSSELKEEYEKGGGGEMRSTPVHEEVTCHGFSSVSAATAVTRGHPFCSLRPSDTGILALRTSFSPNSGSGSASTGHYTNQEAHMPSTLRDGQQCSNFGHDGDALQLLSWKAALEGAIDAMRIEAARRQATAVMESL